MSIGRALEFDFPCLLLQNLTLISTEFFCTSLFIFRFFEEGEGRGERARRTTPFDSWELLTQEASSYTLCLEQHLKIIYISRQNWQKLMRNSEAR